MGSLRVCWCRGRKGSGHATIRCLCQGSLKWVLHRVQGRQRWSVSHRDRSSYFQTLRQLQKALTTLPIWSQLEASQSSEPRPNCVVSFLASPEGPHLFLCLNQASSSYPKDDVVSELKQKVKTSDLTRITEYGFWSQASWMDFLPPFLLFLLSFTGLVNLGKFLKNVWGSVSLSMS